MDFEDVGAVGEDGGAMGDDDDCGARSRVGYETREKFALRSGVEGGGGLVEQYEAALFEKAAGYGYALGLSLAETAATLEALRVETVGQVEDEIGHSRPESFLHTGIVSLGVGQKKIIAHGAADEGVALRHIDDIMSQRGRYRPGAPRGRIELGAARNRSHQPEHEAQEGAFAAARGACHGRDRPGPEIMVKTGDDIGVAVGIAVADIGKTQSCRRSGLYAARVAVLDRHGKDLVDAVDGHGSVDEGGYAMREVEDRALHLGHELQEGRHHAEGNDTGGEAAGAPEECDGISEHETGRDDGIGEDGDVGAPQDARGEAGLEGGVGLGAAPGTHERREKSAVMEAFLKEGLDAAVVLAYLACDTPCAADIYLAHQQSHRHDEDHSEGQAGVEDGKEDESAGKLQAYCRNARQRGARQRGEGGDIVAHAAYGVAVVHGAATRPFRLQQTREQTAAQIVGIAREGYCLETAAHGGYGELQQKTAGKEGHKAQGNVVRRRHGEVDDPLGSPHEQKGCAYVKTPGDSDGDSERPCAVRFFPYAAKIADYFADTVRFHLSTDLEFAQAGAGDRREDAEAPQEDAETMNA